MMITVCLDACEIPHLVAKQIIGWRLKNVESLRLIGLRVRKVNELIGGMKKVEQK